MKHYRIIRKTKKFLRVQTNKCPRKTEILERVWYIAKQRFLWFFWIRIGHKDSLTGLQITYEALTKEEMEEYLKAWHDVSYGKEEYKIDYYE